MPNTRSAAKMMRVAERRRLRNRAIKSAVKTYIRKAERGIQAAAEDASALVVQAVRALDKAASKGVLHRGNAARRKSRLMKKFNAAMAAAPATAPGERSGGAARATRPSTRPRSSKQS